MVLTSLFPEGFSTVSQRGRCSAKNSFHPHLTPFHLTLTGKRNAKKAITATDGKFEIIKVLAGMAQLTITAPGYKSCTVNLTILRGKILNLSYELEAQVISFATA